MPYTYFNIIQQQNMSRTYMQKIQQQLLKTQSKDQLKPLCPNRKQSFKNKHKNKERVCS